MSLPAGHAALARDLPRLAPYARASLARAADLALWLHADELTPEHLLAALLRDEECGATRLVLHAFADPQTIEVEVVALCPGILVVASSGSLPFSARALDALARARGAASGPSGAVLPVHVFRSAEVELPAELRAALVHAGLRPAPAAERGAERVEGPFFGPFSLAARRALGAACKFAHRFERAAISPAHLMLGSLEAEPSLEEEAGLGASRLRLLVSGRDADDTRLGDRELRPDPTLLELLARLPDGAGTSEILGDILLHGREEVRALLHRQKITPALFERSGQAFRDPDEHDPTPA